MLLARLYRPQSSSQAWARASITHLHHSPHNQFRQSSSNQQRRSTREHARLLNASRRGVEIHKGCKYKTLDVNGTLAGADGHGDIQKQDIRSRRVLESPPATKHDEDQNDDLGSTQHIYQADEQNDESFRSSQTTQSLPFVAPAKIISARSGRGFKAESVKPKFGIYGPRLETIGAAGHGHTYKSHDSGNSGYNGASTTTTLEGQIRYGAEQRIGCNKNIPQYQETSRETSRSISAADTKGNDWRSPTRDIEESMSAFDTDSIDLPFDSRSEPAEPIGSTRTSTSNGEEGHISPPTLKSTTGSKSSPDGRHAPPLPEFTLPVGNLAHDDVLPPASEIAKIKEPIASPQSLFEELFPDEARNARKRRNTASKRHTKLPQEFAWAKSWPTIAIHPETASHPSTPPYREPMSSNANPAVAKQRRDAHVLALSSASPNLAPSDFLRLSPKGIHIDGWHSGILKIIPGRDPQTLSNLGHYFILFSSAAAARAYEENVIRLHKISRTYTPTGLGSALPPPPGYIKNGEDIHQLMSEFTLVPASQPRANIRLLPKPFTPTIQRLIEDGGVPALVRLQVRTENLVLLNFDNGGDFGFISEHEVRRWLALDGRQRGLPWGLINGDSEIVRLGSKSATSSSNSETDRATQKTSTSRSRLSSRFVLSFKEQVEARRFVRQWHKQLFKLESRSSESDRAGNAPMVVNAELLW